MVESIPRGSFRNAINAGLPFLPHCPGVTDLVEDGDDLQVDFKNGEFINISKKSKDYFRPLDEKLQTRLEIGDWKANFSLRLSLK